MIALSTVTVASGDRIIFKYSDLLIRSDDKVSLVGPNGAGKTTVLKLLACQVIKDPINLVGGFSCAHCQDSCHPYLNR